MKNKRNKERNKIEIRRKENVSRTKKQNKTNSNFVDPTD